MNSKYALLCLKGIDFKLTKRQKEAVRILEAEILRLNQLEKTVSETREYVLMAKEIIKPLIESHNRIDKIQRQRLNFVPRSTLQD